MRYLTAVVATAIALCLAPAPLMAHDITYKGAVIAAGTTKGKTSIRVLVANEKTKKSSPMEFEVDKETKILRGDTVVTFAEARIQKNEKIAVTIDHDGDETLAIVVRLDERK